MSAFPFALLLASILAFPAGGTAQCSAGAYGQGCGPTATASIVDHGSTHRIELAVHNAAPRVQVIMVIGTQQLNVPIPGTNCLLLTDFVFHQVHRTDGNGEYSFSKAIPRFSPGPPTYAQFLEVTFDQQNNLVLRSTNGVSLVCN